MTMSPLNAKLISNASNLNKKSNKKPDRHENLYKDLIAESAIIKPNKAKAVLIRENPLQSIVSSVKDFVNDGKNFFTAVKTGKMDDNSLGRINDFGMKAGGLLIATFLASKAKTKTSAIMQYIGGGAFFASMALWPKIFINLPARLVHGFRIDQKYISAQGEKKDFFLDNQFLPWDAFSQDELRQNAKRSGIDYDSENGDEKIKRKMQKTALQNRTLWMATAGFSTPLMTALFGDFVEPKVKDAVIKKGFKNSQKAVKNLDKTIANAKPIVRNSENIKDIMRKLELGKIKDDEMFESLAKSLSQDLNEVFNDIDDTMTVKDLKFEVSKDTLKALRLEKSSIETNNLKDVLKQITNGSIAAKLQSKSAQNALSSETIDEIINTFKQSSTRSWVDLYEIVKPYAQKAGINSDNLRNQMDKLDFRYDDSKFFDLIQEYNTAVLGQIRGRLKEYLGTVLNPVIGSKDESVYTDIYRQAMDKALPKTRRILGFSIYDNAIVKTLKEIKSSHKKCCPTELKYQASDAMAKVFSKIAGIKDEQEYLSELKKLYVKKDDSISEFLKLAVDDRNIAKITSVNVSENKDIFENMMGDAGNSISKCIKVFSDNANTNIDAIRSKALIGVNLERRIANKTFDKALLDAGIVSEEFPIDDLIKKARYMVYQGTVASDACELEFKNENLFKTLRNIVYDSESFELEKKISSELDGILNRLRNLGTTSKDNSVGVGLANLEKTYVTDILNNLSWKKIVIPAFAVLVAITLLVQPLFGNIKKEFPKENEGGEK